jgi:YbbR domain-containing protein
VKRLMHRLFVEHAAFKIVALILAVTLFILVRGDKETERSLRVAIAYTHHDQRVLVGEVPSWIDVRVRGPWTRLRRLDAESIDPILIDLTGVVDGEVPLSEDLLRLPPGVRVRSIKPAKIVVQFEHEKRLPIVVETSGAPAKGHRVERVTPSPPTITVKGPKAALDVLADVRSAPISVAGRKESFHQSVPLAPLGDELSVAGPAGIDVEVVIGEEQAKRSLRDARVVVRGSDGKPGADGLELTPATVEIVLLGARDQVDAVDAARVTAYIELRPTDVFLTAARPARVLIEGLPPGVAVEVRPREVSLGPRAPAR